MKKAEITARRRRRLNRLASRRYRLRKKAEAVNNEPFILPEPTADLLARQRVEIELGNEKARAAQKAEQVQAEPSPSTPPVIAPPRPVQTKPEPLTFDRSKPDRNRPAFWDDILGPNPEPLVLTENPRAAFRYRGMSEGPYTVIPEQGGLDAGLVFCEAEGHRDIAVEQAAKEFEAEIEDRKSVV
jgi:hypothetical protein